MTPRERTDALFSEDHADYRMRIAEDCKCHRQTPCRYCVEVAIEAAVAEERDALLAKAEEMATDCDERATRWINKGVQSMAAVKEQQASILRELIKTVRA